MCQGVSGWGQISIVSSAFALRKIAVKETWVQLCHFHFHLLTHHLSLKPLPFLAPLHIETSDGATKVEIAEPEEDKAQELLFPLRGILFPSLKIGKLQRNRKTITPNFTTSQQPQERVWFLLSNFFS